MPLGRGDLLGDVLCEVEFLIENDAQIPGMRYIFNLLPIDGEVGRVEVVDGRLPEDDGHRLRGAELKLSLLHPVRNEVQDSLNSAIHIDRTRAFRKDSGVVCKSLEKNIFLVRELIRQNLLKHVIIHYVPSQWTQDAPLGDTFCNESTDKDTANFGETCSISEIIGIPRNHYGIKSPAKHCLSTVIDIDIVERTTDIQENPDG